MTYLKIVLYGILAFIERNPVFCIVTLLIAIFAPFIFKWFLWVLLGFLILALLGILFMALRFRRMKRQLEKQMRDATGFGNMGSAGFGNMGGAGFGNMGANPNVTLEEFVRQMQAAADARQRSAGTSSQGSTSSSSAKPSSVDSTDYVDFEEVK